VARRVSVDHLGEGGYGIVGMVSKKREGAPPHVGRICQAWEGGKSERKRDGL